MRFRYKPLLAASVLLAALCFTGTAHAREYWEGWWHLPEGVSSYSADVDNLFYFILALTGVVFVGTEAALVYFLIKYRRREGEKSYYSHGSHKLEMVWTITPAIILIVIALIQAKTWNHIKSELPPHETSLKVHLFAQQFSWFFRYPDADGKFSDPKKCVTLEKRLVVPKDTPVIVQMTSNDVIHSFFLPYMRLKQDLVPGMMINCWFDASKTTREMRETRQTMALRDPNGKLQVREWDYPIACAELCGIQHYQMSGIVQVLEKPEYEKFIAAARAGFDSGTFPDDPAIPTELRGTTAEESEIYQKYWQVDPASQERIYGGTNRRTALKVYKAAHAAEGHAAGEAHVPAAGEAEKK